MDRWPFVTDFSVSQSISSDWQSCTPSEVEPEVGVEDTSAQEKVKIVEQFQASFRLPFPAP